MHYYLNGDWGTRDNQMEHPKNVGVISGNYVSLLSKIPPMKSNLLVLELLNLVLGIHIFSIKEITLPLGSAIDQDSTRSNK